MASDSPEDLLFVIVDSLQQVCQVSESGFVNCCIKGSIRLMKLLQLLMLRDWYR